jgi:hypothetical protein
MGFKELMERIGKGAITEDDPNSCGDKHLDYLRNENKMYEESQEKKYLKKKLLLIQKQRNQAYVKQNFVKYKGR